MRVRMGFEFSVYRSINRAESDRKEAALRCTRSSGAESFEEDALGGSGASAEEALSLGVPKTQLRKQNWGSARRRPKWTLDRRHAP